MWEENEERFKEGSNVVAFDKIVCVRYSASDDAITPSTATPNLSPHLLPIYH